MRLLEGAAAAVHQAAADCFPQKEWKGKEPEETSQMLKVRQCEKASLLQSTFTTTHENLRNQL